MKQYTDLLAKLNAPDAAEAFKRIEAEKPKDYKPPRRLFIKSGIKPVDLYCYLYSRFGAPNGFQSFLRKDDSNNMFHWHYSLWADDTGIEIMAATYKIEVWLPEKFCFTENPLEDFVKAIIDDLPNQGEGLKKIRSNLEKWFLFANPVRRLQLALSGMLKRAGELLEMTKHPPKQPETIQDSEAYGAVFQPLANASSEAFGLCRSVRMLSPVLAESFVNLLIFLLCKSEIRADERLYENVKRAPIDIRIKSLSLNCIGFAKPVDYSTDVCKGIHSMFNSRNDFLHGNIDPKNDHHELVYFNGTVPLFAEWKDFYKRCFASQLKSNDYEAAGKEMQLITAFMEQVIEALDPNVAQEIKKMLRNR
jgi:hypothetical protein